MKSDVDKYIAKRKSTDKAFAKDFDAGYAQFKRRAKKFSGISFCNSPNGRDAYLTGHRVSAKVHAGRATLQVR